ncbi:MAG: right-handed parallel beta-helix repeat-containing protein [Candidatus Cellulosilyticum pullistercoris]|uniref:Right-handed parallel beta-helix repeat-containing protein n=1 Tax=Candidatus Cellulosilyticum pullistercoris TaxID=2838521 RepID=A0A9E2KC84_9FIRM|nr:right-handed parallel beta-helix repeat-containing protein [Candidatus Cellulosilyticum pullistercoris]
MKFLKRTICKAAILALMVGMLNIHTVPLQAATTYYYVSVSGSDSNDGSSRNTAFKTLDKALSKASAGTTIFLLNGTYESSSTYKLSKNGTSSAPIKILNYSGHSPVVDFSSQPYADSSRGFQISGDYWIISGLTIKNAGDNGIYISGNNNRVQDCTITKCGDTGLQLSNGASYNQITRVTSTSNYDSKTDGENADGFAAKLSVGPGNVFRDCIALYNSDDGFDLYNATNAVKFYGCEASYNGTNSGNGQGFKVGGNYTADNHYLEDCVATGNKSRGFDQNNNTGYITLKNCIAQNNNVNFYFPKAPASGTHKFTGCQSINGTNKDKIVGATTSGCSFNL